MNISSHFRTTYSPPQLTLPPPSSLRPHQGCRGTKRDESSSTNAPRPNPPTQACTSQPPPLATAAKSRDTTRCRPRCTTNESTPRTRLTTTRQSRREICRYLARKARSKLLSCLWSLSTSALSRGSSPPTGALRPFPLPLHLHPHLHSLLLLPHPLLCP